MKKASQDIFEPEIPVVPSGWVVLPFEQAADVISDKGKRVKQGSYVPVGKIPVIDQGQDTIGGYTNDENMAFDDGLPVILFGDHTRSLKYVDKRFAVGAEGVKILRPREGYVPKFFYYLLRSLQIPSRGYSRHFQFLRKFHFPLAPEEQQKGIVAEIEKQFSRLDEAVANLKRVKANLKRYKAAVPKAAVEGKLTEAWRKQHPDIEPASKLIERILVERGAKWSGKRKRKEPAFPNNANSRPLPKGWCWVSLDQMLWQFRSGTAETSARDPTDYPVLKSSAVRHGVIDYADLNYLRKSQSMRPENFLRHGDFLITRLSGSVDYVGCSALVKDIACDRIQYPDRIFCGKLVSGVDGTYLSYCFQHPSIRKALETAAKSTAGHQRISMSDLYPLTLPLPSTAEQEVIVAEVERRLSVIKELEAAVQANLTRANRLRQSILSGAFSGRLFTQEMLPTHSERKSVS